MVEAMSVNVYSLAPDQKIPLLLNSKTQYRLQQREKLHPFLEKISVTHNLKHNF